MTDTIMTQRLDTIQSQFLSAYQIDTSLCDDIIEAFESNPDYTEAGVAGGSINPGIKKSHDQVLDRYSYLYKRYMDKLQECLNLYMTEYEYCNKYNPFSITDATNIQKYEPNDGFYSWHTERSGVDPLIRNRHLVFMTYLNVVADGGDTEWFYQDLKIKPKTGLTVIWPADWTFTHRGIPSQTETKYIVTGWFSYIGFNDTQDYMEQGA